MALPYLTADLPGIPAVYKQRPEDFRVEEIPAYEPSGAGTHVYFGIEKTGMSTTDAIRAIARALGVAPRAIGCAGLKDARGVARQVLSLEHADPARVAALALRNLSVLWVSRHHNKLRTGHLRGNRFAIRLRGCEPESAGAVRAVLGVLERRGVPNYFGEQRFGARGDNWQVGRALLLGDAAEAAAWIAGRPSERDSPAVRRARERFDRGDYAGAARAWPGAFRDPIRVSRALARGADPARALRALDRSLLRFYASAYQSHLFNQVVAARIAGIDRVLAGDLAWKHANGAVFRVEDPEREASRAEAGEISPTGPLFGRRMTRPSGEPDRIESEVLAQNGHERGDLERPGPYRGWVGGPGGRRPLRFLPGECRLSEGSDAHGPWLELGFVLPAGCYATTLLREILKPREVSEELGR